MLPRARTELAWILVGIVVGAITFHFLVLSVSDFEPADAGLGMGTSGHTAYFDGERISARPADVPALLETFRAWREEGGKRIYLWLGASQLHAVNQLEDGDELAIFYATASARKRGSDVAYLQLSTPNGSLNDMLAFYLAGRVQGLIPDGLIIAMTYDDLRESEIQRRVLEHVPPIEDALAKRFGGGLSNVRSAQQANAEPKTEEAVERSPTTGTPQAILEDSLQTALADGWTAYEIRGKLTATWKLLILGGFAQFRGEAMDRRSAPIPAPVQEWNLAALDSLLALAKEDGVSDRLVYKPPHRPSEGVFFHDRARYDAFFAALRTKLIQSGTRYADFESIVPQDYWGLTNSGRPDVFHFMDYGHRQLGAAIDRTVEQATEQTAKQSVPRRGH